MDWRAALIEREQELKALDAIRAAARTDGRAVVIDGPAGIGKTRLLDTLRAGGRGVDVLAARGGILERDIAFGVARQLLERRVRSAPAEEQAVLLAGAAAPAAGVLGLAAAEPGPLPSDPGRALHSLFWLVVNLAERAPLVLAVDDVQWADAASVEFLAYLARRLEGLPVLLALASRQGEPWSHGTAKGEILTHADVIEPAPLTEAGVGRLVGLAFGRDAPPGLVEACAGATGGNPFYLGELLGSVATPGRDPADVPVDAVTATVPSTVARAILLRVGAMGDGAVRLAKAAALLGDGASLAEAAAVADLDAAGAERAADGLVAAFILAGVQPLRFAHPIVWSAIDGETPPARRGALHRQAALVLHRHGVARERIVPHLLRATPTSDPWVVEILHRAAQEAAARGAPGVAVACLRRALDEPPFENQAGLRAELSGVELAAGAYFESAESAQRAVEAASGPLERALIRLPQAYALMSVEGSQAALQCIEQGVEEAAAGDAPDLAMVLEGELAVHAWMAGVRHPVLDRMDLDRDLQGESYGARYVLAVMANEALLRGRAAPVARDLALRALAGGRLVAEQSSATMAFYAAATSLLAAEAWEEGAAAVAEGLADCRRRGMTYGYGGLCWLQGLLALAHGDLAAAEAEERACVEHAVPTMVGIGAASLALVLLEQGDAGAAEDELARHGLLGDARPLFVWGPYVRARVRLAEGRAGEALADLGAVGRQATEVGGFAVGLPWRAYTALALHAVGDGVEARRVAAGDVAGARRHGGARALGTALWAAALVGPGGERLAALTEAVAVLEASPARLELARARYDLGLTLLRAGRRREGRELLQRAYDGARACGARGLAQDAYDELLVAGARPRRLTFTGIESLTASEHRVASMAAEGMTNRDIAQALFVTPKTVENQLGRVYGKLGVSSRRALREVLAPARSRPVPHAPAGPAYPYQPATSATTWAVPDRL